MRAGLIHIVDDDELIRDSTSCVLEDAGYDVCLHASGDAFITSADLSAPACIILDLEMPGAGGFDVLAHLAERQAPVSVVIVSGHVDVQVAVRAIKTGAVNVVRKPWRVAALLTAVEQAFAATKAGSPFKML